MPKILELSTRKSSFIAEIAHLHKQSVSRRRCEEEGLYVMLFNRILDRQIWFFGNCVSGDRERLFSASLWCVVVIFRSDDLNQSLPFPYFCRTGADVKCRL